MISAVDKDDHGLVVRGLTVRDGARDIVSGLDLAVPAGARHAVIGTSSADVSAVLSTVAALRPAAAGTIEVAGRVLGPDEPPTRVGYVSQDHHLIGTLTAVENLLVTMMAAGSRKPDADTIRRAEEQLEALALAPATWHNLVEQLSGGQQQRVALARSLVLRPRLLVLDHPTSELDPDSVDLVDRVLTEVSATGTCCLLATDDPLLLPEDIPTTSLD